MRNRALLALSVSASLCILGGIAPTASAEVLEGRGLVCDSEPQLAKAIAAFDRGENGVEAVNKDEPRACGILSIAYTRREKVGEVATRHGRLDIVRIEIVAVHDGARWHPAASVSQLTAMPPDEPPEAAPSSIVDF